MTGRRKFVRIFLAPALAAAFFVAYFSPVLFGGKILAPGDGFLQNYPSFRDAGGLWNPDLFSGYPAFADPQAARWYPVRVLCAAVGSFDVFTISAYVLASLFAFLLGTRLSGSRTAGVLAGLVYGTGGFFMSHLGHGNMIHAAAWLPLLLLALHELGERPSYAWFLSGSGAVACSVLAGHPQSFVLSLLVAGAFSLFTAFAVSRTPFRFLGLASACLLAGLGLAAVALVPMVELSSLSVRSKLPFEEFASFSLPLRQLPALLFPALFGGMPSPLYPFPYIGKWNVAEVTAWAGVTTLLLAGFALVLPGRRKEALFWTAMGALGITFALGPDGPAAGFLYGVPVLSKFRAQGRHALEFTMAASVLAAYGLAALQRLGARGRVRGVLIGTALGGAVLLAVLWGLDSTRILESMAKGVAGAESVSLSPLRNPAVAIPIGLFTVTAAALLLRAARPSRATAAVLALAFAAELAQYGWFFEWRFSSPKRQEAERPAALDRYANELSQTHQRLLPIAGTDQTGGPVPNLSSIWHLPSASGYNPLMLRRYREFLGIEYWGALIPGRLVPTNLAFDLLAVRWAFLPGSLPNSLAEEERLDVAPLGRSRNMRWSPVGLDINLGPGCNPAYPLRVSLETGGTVADELGVVSSLGCAASVPDGAEVLRITVVRADEGKEVLSFRAGVDTSEWSWERADVRRKVRHRLARPYTDSNEKDDAGTSFVSHTYQTMLRFGKPGSLARLEMEWTGPAGSILVDKVSLRDSASGTVAGLWQHGGGAPTGRWKAAGAIGGSAIYENTKARPRAWLVHETTVEPDEEILRSVVTAKLGDGRPFDPARLAILERPLAASIGPADPGASATVRILGRDAVEVETRSATPSLLVLADVFYPGWEATVDGRPAPVVRADYVLRAAPVAAGTHLVRFEFRPASLRTGAAVSGASFLLLAAGGVWSLARRRRAG